MEEFLDQIWNSNPSLQDEAKQIGGTKEQWVEAMMEGPEQRRIVYDNSKAMQGIGSYDLLEEAVQEYAASGTAQQPGTDIDPQSQEAGFWKPIWEGIKDGFTKSYIGNAVAKGVQQGKQADELTFAQGLFNMDGTPNIDDKGYERIAESIKKTRELQTTTEKEDYWLDSGDFFFQAGQAIISSLTSSGAQWKDIAAGVGTGAVAGLPFEGVGAIPGAGYGLTAAMIKTGMDAEFAGLMLERVEKYATENDLDATNPAHLKVIFSDQTFMEESITDALVGAGIVGGVDLATLGISSKVGAVKSAAKGLKDSGVRTVIGRHVKTMAIEAAGGGTGEAMKEYVLDGKVNWREVAMEAFAEVGSGAVEVSSTVAAEAGRKNAQAKAKAKQKMVEPASKLTNEQFNQEMDQVAESGLFPQEVVDDTRQDFAEVQEAMATLPDEVLSDPVIKKEATHALLDRKEVDSRIANEQAKLEAADEALKPQIQERIDRLNEARSSINSYVSNLENVEMTQEDLNLKNELYDKLLNQGVQVEAGRSAFSIVDGVLTPTTNLTKSEMQVVESTVENIDGLTIDPVYSSETMAEYRVNGKPVTKKKAESVIANNLQSIAKGEMDVVIKNDDTMLESLKSALAEINPETNAKETGTVREAGIEDQGQERGMGDMPGQPQKEEAQGKTETPKIEVPAEAEATQTQEQEAVLSPEETKKAEDAKLEEQAAMSTEPVQPDATTQTRTSNENKVRLLRFNQNALNNKELSKQVTSSLEKFDAETPRASQKAESSRKFVEDLDMGKSMTQALNGLRERKGEPLTVSDLPKQMPKDLRQRLVDLHNERRNILDEKAAPLSEKEADAGGGDNGGYKGDVGIDDDGMAPDGMIGLKTADVDAIVEKYIDTGDKAQHERTVKTVKSVIEESRQYMSTPKENFSREAPIVHQILFGGFVENIDAKMIAIRRAIDQMTHAKDIQLAALERATDPEDIRRIQDQINILTEDMHHFTLAYNKLGTMGGRILRYRQERLASDFYTEAHLTQLYAQSKGTNKLTTEEKAMVKEKSKDMRSLQAEIDKLHQANSLRSESAIKTVANNVIKTMAAAKPRAKRKIVSKLSVKDASANLRSILDKPC